MLTKRLTVTKLGAFLVASLAMATAAQAGVFTITLKNGGTVETRYRPRTADWDENYALIRTDQGNLVAFKKSDIVDITTDIEVGGFGYQLNDTTVFLGWSPNESDEEGGDGQAGTKSEPGGSSGDDQSTAPATSSGDNFVIQDFVDIGADGSVPGSGIPVGPRSNEGKDADGGN